MASISRRGNILFGLILVFVLPIWTAWWVGPQLWSDLAHRPFSVSMTHDVEEATCTRRALVFNDCRILVRDRTNPRNVRDMHFLSVVEWGDLPLRAVESSGRSDRVSISQALDHLADRLLVFLTLNLLSMFIGIAMVDRQLAKPAPATADTSGRGTRPTGAADLVELTEITRPGFFRAP